MSLVREALANPYVRVTAAGAVLVGSLWAVHEGRQNVFDPLGHYQPNPAGISKVDRSHEFELPEFNTHDNSEQVGSAKCKTTVIVKPGGLPVILAQTSSNGEQISVRVNTEAHDGKGEVIVDFKKFEIRQGMESEAERRTVSGKVPDTHRVRIGTSARSTCVRIAA